MSQRLIVSDKSVHVGKNRKEKEDVKYLDVVKDINKRKTQQTKDCFFPSLHESV